MFRMFLFILLLFLVACASAATEEGTNAYLEGNVTVGPLQPVEIAGVTPAPIPSEVYTSRSLNIFAADGETLVTNVPFTAAGTYRATLEPGTYVVNLAPNGIDSSPDVPQTIELEAGQTVRLDINIDTGIR